MVGRRLRLGVTALMSPLVLGACTGLIFHPEPGHRVDPADHGIEYRDVWFEASDGVRLHAWFFPAQGPARGTLVHAHGNAENVSTHSASVVWLRHRGYNVFAFDYRGYGLSGGKVSMVGIHRDTVAALRAADRTDDLPRERLVLFGQSLGGAVATVVTQRIPRGEAPAALAVDSAPSNYRDIAREKLAEWWLTWPLQWPLSWTITDDYSAVEAAPELPPIPKLFIANRRDRTVPPHHAARLYEHAAPPAECWLIDAPGHGGTFNIPALRDAFVDWLDAALEVPGHDEPRTPPVDPCINGTNGAAKSSG